MESDSATMGEGFESNLVAYANRGQGVVIMANTNLDRDGGGKVTGLAFTQGGAITAAPRLP